MQNNHKIGERANSELEVLENPMEWLQSFHEGWLGHFERTKEVDWKKYSRARNRLAPAGPGIKLSESRILLISSAGFYLQGEQTPFDAGNPLGDYSIRVFPSDTPFDALRIAHEHYDNQYAEADPQVLLPLRHLEAMEAQGLIGEFAPMVVSFMGYQPNVIRTVKELIPDILAAARKVAAHGALLVPS